MAARKLMQEVERVLKKVDEGVLVFEATWDKVYAASSAPLKEKYEGDLKKEIKKLQRLRDQIKTWQGESSIKDKSKIDAARKLIEDKMEKFKICEKETKTKAFSREGLAQDRTDPHEKAKMEVRGWISTFIGTINDQLEEFEVEMESLKSAGGGGKKKKQSKSSAPSSANVQKIEAFERQVERHRHHVEMMERILRAVENETVSTEEADELKEQIEFYIEHNQDQDYYEDEEMYDHLELQRAVPAPVVAIPGKKGAEKSDELAEDSDKKSTSGPTLALSPKGSGSISPKIAIKQSSQRSPVAAKDTSRGATDPVPRPAATAKSATTAVLPAASGGPTNSGTIAGASGKLPLMSSIVKGSSTQSSAVSPASGPSSVPSQPLTRFGAPSGVSVPPKTEASIPDEKNSTLPAPPSALGPLGAVSSHAPAALVNQRAGLSPVVGGVMDLDAQMSFLDEAAAFMPEAAPPSAFGEDIHDRGTEGSHGAENAQGRSAITPASFPQTAATVFDNPAVFEKFDHDTLFYIFYYQQGTYQQYLAAKELKRQAWRFHKKYSTWFQRLEEPKYTTDNYEQGTYVYFDYVLKDDYETGWCQRIKTEFLFNYDYLEDELPVSAP